MLIEFDKDNINAETLEKLEPYVRDLNVNPQKVAKTSKACYALWIYIVAIYKYGVYVKEINARRLKLRQEARKGNRSGNPT